MKDLTRKQQLIYDYIRSFVAENGYPPSVREIAQAMGLASPSTVHFHLKALAAAGVIEKTDGKTRAIRLVGESAPEPVMEELDSRQDRIPILGSVAAGSPILADEYIEDYLTFDTQGTSGEHFALIVRGESMLNAGILPGDYVIVHRQTQCRSGEIVVALFEDEATVKTLSYQEGHVWLLPENPEYEPILGDNALLLGKVIAVVRRY